LIAFLLRERLYKKEKMPEPNFEEAESAEAAEAVPLFQCDDCGNFWDGAAQCLCGGWGLEAEEDSESGYESN